MNILENVSLKPYNTFGIDVRTKYLVAFKSVEELREILLNERFRDLKKFILGGGSNILFTGDFDGIVLKNEIEGINAIHEDGDFVYVKSGAGENWHRFVLWCLDKNYAGIENLSLIPGNIGAGPIQNIGAYGVELKDVFHELEAVNISNGECFTLNKEQCKFGYRDSIFKNELKGKVVVVSVILKLCKNPQLNTSYGAIEQELKKMGEEQPTIKSISEAVCKIRRSKLPDPAILGNAGSFFKNPEIDRKQFDELKAEFPSIAGYELPNGHVKLAAGWLIEQCGWKGKVVGNTGSHKDQALVLVNYGNANGSEIYELAKTIRNSVMEKFRVDIEPEVNVM